MTKYYLLENREIFFPTNTYTIEVTDKKFLKTIKKLIKDKISVFITNKRKPIDAYDEEFSEDEKNIYKLIAERYFIQFLEKIKVEKTEAKTEIEETIFKKSSTKNLEPGY